MEIHLIFLFVVTLIAYSKISSIEYSAKETQLKVNLQIEDQYRTNSNWLNGSVTLNSTNLHYLSSLITNRSSISSVRGNVFPLINSDCYCSYDQRINLLTCSPLLRYSFAFLIPSKNTSSINITLNDCTFSDNRLHLPIIKEKQIDHLHLHNINYQDYYVLDKESFSSYLINHLSIYYHYTQSITVIIMSNETFSSTSINLSLRTLHIDSCYLLAFNKPFNKLSLLESMTLKNIYQFSWYDFHQEIKHLPRLRYLYISDEYISTKNNIFNVLSCEDISSQWIFTYRLIQTCSCKFISFLKTMHNGEHAYKCPNSDYTIDFIDNICQFNGKKYKIGNQINLFCNKCLSYRCSNQTACSEALNSEPNCLSLSRNDYKTIHTRMPLTFSTEQFLRYKTPEHSFENSNRTLESNEFYSISAILIDSNRNHSENSTIKAQLFHETLTEMLSRPWSPEIYTSVGQVPKPPSRNATRPPSSVILQQLITSLEESVKNIDENESKFEFQSESISTVSLRISNIEQGHETFGWKITMDNKIIANITHLESIDKDTSSRVFLKFDSNPFNQSTCNYSS